MYKVSDGQGRGQGSFEGEYVHFSQRKAEAIERNVARKPPNSNTRSGDITPIKHENIRIPDPPLPNP
ncbi:uncharacterized protein N7479_004444 [Penicillium vulpinum]|uniref:uncharacterized protein n=1 Tax=Penicillium vulpinum TaxID=29845 RepID=UPI002547A8D1|nr:uncharacterized protein N7479_004444 [Penicillium vulpinum]KAJ5964568.1 hypothetical protein N7479_004444 [Penicillium vulpinum]